MINNKKYPITEELRDVVIESKAQERLRDKYIELRYFGHKLASKAAFKAEKLKATFWRGVYDEYPELEGKKILYNLNLNDFDEDKES